MMDNLGRRSLYPSLWLSSEGLTVPDGEAARHLEARPSQKHWQARVFVLIVLVVQGNSLWPGADSSRRGGWNGGDKTPQKLPFWSTVVVAAEHGIHNHGGHILYRTFRCSGRGILYRTTASASSP